MMICPCTVEDHRIRSVKGGVRSSSSHGDNMTVISMIKVDKKVDHKYLGTTRTVKTNAHESAMERTIVYFGGI